MINLSYSVKDQQLTVNATLDQHEKYLFNEVAKQPNKVMNKNVRHQHPIMFILTNLEYVC
jgi:hypothetical protein